MASDDYSAVAGAVAAVVNASWATATATRKAVDWLPRRDVPVLREDGTFTDVWFRFFAEVSRRLGGIQGASITDISASVSNVQSELTSTTETAIAAAAATAANTNSIDVIREVAVNAGLPGSSNIP